MWIIIGLVTALIIAGAGLLLFANDALAICNKWSFGTKERKNLLAGDGRRRYNQSELMLSCFGNLISLR